ncbi:MAG: HAD family hydrolase, partial [Candidatus Aenigmarchaeota archaeon]|nr:HAD family hydrolase [Candidatus Aenigmarchaeota archaeon]
INDEPFHLAAVNSVITPLGIPEVPASYWKTECVGLRLADTLPKIVNDGLRPADYERIILEYLNAFKGLVRGRAREIARDGVLDFIGHLAKNRKRMAVATSARKDLAYAILGPDGLDIWNVFEKIVTGDMIPKGLGKPKPDTYRLACPEGLRPYQCVAFEDAGPGVESAYGAEMPVIAYPSEFTDHHDFGNAVYVVDNLTRAAKIIRHGRRPDVL